MIAAKCADCGAYIPHGYEGCEALWHEAFYVYQIGHPAAFDAYCMQHLPRYCASAKSYAAHLTRLCCGLEYDADVQVYGAIQRWLNGNRMLEKPASLPFLGAITIADVHQAQWTTAVVQAWVESVWAAYAPQHALAHAWIQEALAATKKGKQ